MVAKNLWIFRNVNNETRWSRPREPRGFARAPVQTRELTEAEVDVIGEVEEAAASALPEPHCLAAELMSSSPHRHVEWKQEAPARVCWSGLVERQSIRLD